MLFVLVFAIESPVIAQGWTKLGDDLVNFGSFVQLSHDGKTVAFGNHKYSQGGMVDVGRIKVRFWNGSGWFKKGMDLFGMKQGEKFGDYLCLDSAGNTLAVGIPNDSENGLHSGQVRVYEWNGQEWEQKGSILKGDTIGDEFGKSVDLSSDGNTLVVGVIGFDHPTVDAGIVRIFTWDGASWIQKGNDLLCDSCTNYGEVVNISGDGNIVASNWDDIEEYQRHILVNEWNGSSWNQKGETITREFYGDDDFSKQPFSLSLDGQTVGASLQAGLKVFTWNESGELWEQKGGKFAIGFGGDFPHQSVNMDEDGNSLMVGGSGLSGNGGETGYYGVYDWGGSKWELRGNVYSSNGGDADMVCSISADGKITAMANLYDLGFGIPYGCVYTSDLPVLSSHTYFDLKQWKYGPNPLIGSSNITMSLGRKYPVVHVSVQSITGMELGTYQYVEKEEIKVEIPLEAGCYIVKIINDTGESSRIRIVRIQN